MKKILSMTLALTMCLSVAATASAAAGKYDYTITVNGAALDTSAIPAISEAAVPLRAVAEADNGFAEWYPDEHLSMFVLDGNIINADTATCVLTVNDEAVKGQATFIGGVTFVPASVLELVPGYSVKTSGKNIEITTPNGAPLTQMAYSILDQVECGATSKQNAANMETYYGIEAENFEEVVGFFPFNVSPDTLIIGKVKSGKLDAVKEDFEAYRKSQEDTFSWYLSQHLPTVQNAQTVVEGDYVCFVIADDADTVVSLFRAAVKDL